MKALNVQPALLVQVKDFAEFIIDSFVVMRPNSSFFQFKEGMHAGSKELGTVFLHNLAQRQNPILHCLLKLSRRPKRRVSFKFHYVHLQFFAEREGWQLNEVDCSSAIAFDDFVGYG
jgi:hypothetical protein